MLGIDGQPLPAGVISAVAHQGETVTVTAAALERAAQSQAYADEAATGRVLYGRSTGVGANRSVAVRDPDAHAMRLLRSHATSAGPLRSPERVRAMLVVRLNQLAVGGSGAQPALLEALVEMLAADALPPVREFGSIGTADLPALATTALALAGELPTSNPLDVRIDFRAGDAGPFLSSNAATIGDAAIAQHALATQAQAAMRVAALTFTTVDGNPEAFAEVVERATPFDGAREVCRTMRGLILNPDGVPARVQDPFGLRTIPQVHGAYLDALTLLDRVITAMASAPSENPVAVPGFAIAHHGGFHAAYLGQALSAVLSAAAQSAQLSGARLAMLAEPAFTRLPPFLGDGTPGASGVMITEYVSAAATAELSGWAAPAAVQTATLSMGVEDDASFAALAASQAIQAVEAYRIVLACELVSAVRAMRMRGIEPVGPVAELSADTADRDLTADLEQAGALLDRL